MVLRRDKKRECRRCKFIRYLKMITPWITAGLGGFSIRDIFIDWQTYKNEISVFLYGHKEFSLIDPKAQYFLISLLLFSVALIAYIVSWKLYNNWKCWQKDEGQVVEAPGA